MGLIAISGLVPVHSHYRLNDISVSQPLPVHSHYQLTVMSGSQLLSAQGHLTVYHITVYHIQAIIGSNDFSAICKQDFHELLQNLIQVNPGCCTCSNIITSPITIATQYNRLDCTCSYFNEFFRFLVNFDGASLKLKSLIKKKKNVT
tara:strand:- start:257 stop:697 length:441 start_codon:yes stop_codon:yes gene_type:complete